MARSAAVLLSLLLPLTALFAAGCERDPRAQVRIHIGDRAVRLVGNHVLSAEQIEDAIAAYDPSVAESAVFALYADAGHAGVEVRLHGDQLRIVEGPRYQIGSYRVTERDGEREVALLPGTLERLAMHVGDRFSRQRLATDIANLRTHYYDAGYGNANVDVATDLERPRREAHVVLTVTRGPLVTIDSVVVDGADRATLGTLIEVAPGQLYSETRLARTRAALEATDAFSRVAVSQRPAGNAIDKIVITIEVDRR